MTSASERRTGQIDGPRGRRFVKVEDWARLPEGRSFCDVPGVTGEPGDKHGAFNIPHAVLVLPDERVLVCDRENKRIQVFDLDGKYLDEWIDLARPDDVCVDDAGNLYVGEVRQAAGADAAGWHNAVRKLAQIA